MIDIDCGASFESNALFYWYVLKVIQVCNPNCKDIYHTYTMFLQNLMLSLKEEIYRLGSFNSTRCPCFKLQYGHISYPFICKNFCVVKNLHRYCDHGLKKCLSDRYSLMMFDKQTLSIRKLKIKSMDKHISFSWKALLTKVSYETLDIIIAVHKNWITSS